MNRRDMNMRNKIELLLLLSSDEYSFGEVAETDMIGVRGRCRLF